MSIIFCSLLLSSLYLISYQVQTFWFAMFHICSFTFYPHLSHRSLALAALHPSWSVIPLQDRPHCHIQSQTPLPSCSESLQSSCSVKTISSWSAPSHPPTKLVLLGQTGLSPPLSACPNANCFKGPAQDSLSRHSAFPKLPLDNATHLLTIFSSSTPLVVSWTIRPREAGLGAFFSYILFHSARHITSTQEVLFGYAMINVQTILFNLKASALISLLSDHILNLEGPKRVMTPWSTSLLLSLPLTHET